MNPHRLTAASRASWRGPLAALLVSLLTACAAPRPEPSQAAPPIAATAKPPSAPATDDVESKRDSAIDRFELLQLDRVEQAMRQGHLADVALAWEVLSLLRPGRGDYRKRLTESRAAIDAAVAQRLVRASAAKQRGDTSGAERAWFEILALDPRHAAAAQALRDLERDRNQASVVGRFAQPPGLGQRTAPLAAQAPAPRGRVIVASPASPGQRNQFEHASMLAGQGEIDAAIALLTEHTTHSPQDTQVRLLLADLHVQRADQRAAGDRVAATADLERALRLNPRLDTARATLQQLKRQPP